MIDLQEAICRQPVSDTQGDGWQITQQPEVLTASRFSFYLKNYRNSTPRTIKP